FVDKSGSMTEAIKVATELAALISAGGTGDFPVYASDPAAFELKVKAERGQRPKLSDWEQVFKLVKADGGTSIGAPLAKMHKEKVAVEQIRLVTAGGGTSRTAQH